MEQPRLKLVIGIMFGIGKVGPVFGTCIVSFRILPFRVFSCFVYSKVKPVSVRY